MEHLSLTIATHEEEARARLGEPLLESLARCKETDLVRKRESAEDDVEQGRVQVRKRELTSESGTRQRRHRDVRV